METTSFIIVFAISCVIIGLKAQEIDNNKLKGKFILISLVATFLLLQIFAAFGMNGLTYWCYGLFPLAGLLYGLQYMDWPNEKKQLYAKYLLGVWITGLYVLPIISYVSKAVTI